MMQAQAPRSAAQLAVCNAAILPSQFQRAGSLSLQRPALGRRTTQRTVVSAKLAKSEPKGQGPYISTVDIVSSGLGAMVCTSFFVSRGQDPWEALTVTACSIIVALVLNQMLFADE